MNDLLCFRTDFQGDYFSLCHQKSFYGRVSADRSKWLYGNVSLLPEGSPWTPVWKPSPYINLMLILLLVCSSALESGHCCLI